MKLTIYLMCFFVYFQVRALCGQRESLKRTVRRAKRSKIPSEPQSASDIPHPLPDEYRCTGEDLSSQFLIYDNGTNSDRMLVFASDIGLKVLAESDTWYMDGTYDTCPKQFNQLYVIRVPVGENFITAAYGLLPSKTQTVYEELFSSVLDACLLKNLRPNPTRIVVDFEIAVHNALKTVLGVGIEIQGCFYHLTQSTWRKIQSEGLQAEYLANEELRHFCGQIDGLAFLPVDHVVRGITHLRANVPDSLIPIVDYFDSVYVSGTYRSVRGENGLLRFRRTPPRFPPHTWNVFEATVSDRSRTNNVCEGWNNGFKSLVGHSNPSLWYILSCLQKDNSSAETIYRQTELGLAAKKRKTMKTIQHQQRLKKLCDQYSSGEKNLGQFMLAIGSCIRLH